LTISSLLVGASFLLDILVALVGLLAGPAVRERWVE
jgi:hypothetical protein